MGELELRELLNKAGDALKKNCEDRGLDEYLDDIRLTNDGFCISIYRDNELVTDFEFQYDDDDPVERTAEEQLDDALDEFISIHNYDAGIIDEDDDEFDEEGYTHTDYIVDCINDAVDDVWNSYKAMNPNSDHQADQDEIIEKVIEILSEQPYYLVEGDDYDWDDIRIAVGEYEW